MILFMVLLSVTLTAGKIYDRCELARELKYVHKAPPHQVGTWVCIAEHESTYNTSITGYLSGDGSADHGLFQISDKYWCSPPGKGTGCGVTCAELEDDDIADDYACAQLIYKEHKDLSGDGFTAWAVYAPHCKGPKAERYTKGCFNDSEEPKHFAPEREESPLVFAHGFFGTAAGRTNKGFFAPTETLPFDAFFTPTTSFIPTTKRPTTSNLAVFNPTNTLSTFPAIPSRSSIFSSSRTFPTQTSSLSAFNPSGTFSTFEPTRSTIFGSHRTQTTRNLNAFNPSNTFSSFEPSRSTIFGSSRTFPKQTTSSLFAFDPINAFPIFASRRSSDGDISSALPTSTKATPKEPIFIINGVKWN